MLEQIINENKLKMNNVIEKAKMELGKLSVNFANINILSDVTIEYYGSYMPILQLAKINIIDGKKFIIKPYDNKLLANIASAIIKKNLGLNPLQNADNITINIPQLTEAKRKEIVKKLHNIIELHKVSIRNIRRTANQIIKNDKNLSKNQQQDADEKIQKITNESINELTKLSIKKEKEILTI